MFHLGWFIGKGYSPHNWHQPWSGTIGADWMKPDLYMDLARGLERACFDCLILEDGSFIADVFQEFSRVGTSKCVLGAQERSDAVGPVAWLRDQTDRHRSHGHNQLLSAVSGGASGRDTGSTDGGTRRAERRDRAQRPVGAELGLDRHYEHDLRYEMADKWMEICDRLWQSWEPGAIAADPDTGMFADHTKIHPIHFEGRFYRSRGPLNTAPGPQRRPVICQAGGSPSGRAFAAKHADLIIAKVRQVGAAKQYRRDISDLMAKHGRDPGDCKVMYCASVILGDTMEEAHEKQARMAAGLADKMDVKLAAMSYLSGIDCAKFELDAPLPKLTINASRASFEAHLSGDGTRTLREMLLDPGSGGIDFIGTADSIASDMAAVMEEIGGDGFLIQDPLTRKAIVEITDGLVPTLQRRGLTRAAYSHDLFRDNLRAF